MPATNLISRNLRVLIGDDEQDWFEAIGTLGLSRERISDTGLLPITGDLEILPILGAPESIDPYDNPQRWRPGQPVRLQVRDDSGDWVDHPMGRLFILQEPDYPEEGSGITIAVGCMLTWHDSFEFDDDKTGVVVGTPENSATVAQRLLEANEIPTGSIDLGTWPYELAIPEGKGQNSSFVQQAGGLAYSNDWRYLYQDISGDVVAAALDLSIGAPVITITLGDNDVAYQRIKVEGDPPEKVRVAGTGTTISEGVNPSVETSEVSGDRSQFQEGNVTCPGAGIISRSTTRVSWTTAGDIVTYRILTTLEAPRSAVACAPGVIDFPCDLIQWKKTEEVKRFDLADGGRLIDKTTTEQQRRFTLSPIAPLLTFVTVREIVETPTYSDREVISQIVAEETQARVTIDPSTDDPFDTVTVSRTETRWRQLGGNTWQKSETKRFPRSRQRSSPDTDPTAAVGSINTTTSSTGEAQPPRAEIWDGGNTEEEVEFQGTADYTPYGQATGRSRKALYTVPHGFSDAQCEGLALKHVALIAGRHRAALIEFEITDALLSAPPLFPCDVIMPDGEVRHYRVDGLAWEHSQTEAKAVGTGILVGTTAAPTVEVPEPVAIPLTAVQVVADDVPVVADDVPVVAVV